MREQDLHHYLTGSANVLPENERLPKLPAQVSLSVVVPAYNEESYVANLISCLDAQSLKPNFEVIIVDNGSTDRTLGVVNSTKSDTRILTIKEPKPGAGNARKAGIDEVARRLLERDGGKQIARHFIALTDADTLPDANWLSDMYQLFSRAQRSILVSGNYKPSLYIDQVVYGSTGIKNYFNVFSTLSEKLDNLVGQTRMRGPNSGIEIECYVLADGFKQPVDSDGNTAPRECFDLARRIDAKGTSIVHFDHPIVTSQRRKLFEIINGIASYETADLKSKRFVSTRTPEEKLLNLAIDRVPIKAWLKYREKILTRIVTNTLIFPLQSKMRDVPQNLYEIEEWSDMIQDLASLDVGELEKKWALRIANEVIQRFNLQ